MKTTCKKCSRAIRPVKNLPKVLRELVDRAHDLADRTAVECPTTFRSREDRLQSAETYVRAQLLDIADALEGRCDECSAAAVDPETLNLQVYERWNPDVSEGLSPGKVTGSFRDKKGQRVQREVDAVHIEGGLAIVGDRFSWVLTHAGSGFKLEPGTGPWPFKRDALEALRKLTAITDWTRLQADVLALPPETKKQINLVLDPWRAESAKAEVAP